MPPVTPLSGRRVLFVMAAEQEYGPHLRARFTPLMTGIGPVEAGIAVSAALALLAGLEAPAAIAVIMQASMPVAVVTIILATEFELNRQLSLSLILASTLVSPVTLSLLILLLSRLAPSLVR